MPHRLAVAASLLALWFVLGASVALAADPPADVVLDGSVTVTFADAAVDGGAGIAGAAITLEARRPDLGADDVIQTLHGTTDADGEATFDDVARPADGAPTVELTATASVSRTTVTADGCLQSEDLEGSATADGAAVVAITVGVGSASSSLECSPLAVTGTVLDPDGQPFSVATTDVTFTGPDGTSHPSITIDEDGAFRIELARWDPGAGATLELTVVSTPTKTVDTGDGCGDTYALVATHTWDLADPLTAPDPVALTAREEVVGQVCQATGTPAPTASGTPHSTPSSTPHETPRATDGGTTLPPTDTAIAGGTTGSADIGPALAVLVFVAAAASALAGRLSRRGS